MSAASDVSGARVLRSLFPPNTLCPASEHPIELNCSRGAVMSDHDFRLMQYHQKLDDELRTEMRRAWPSFARIQRLKRLKLAVKDRLQRLALATKKKRLKTA
jgi:hypothetical protein